MRGWWQSKCGGWVVVVVCVWGWGVGGWVVGGMGGRTSAEPYAREAEAEAEAGGGDYQRAKSAFSTSCWNASSSTSST